MCAQSVEAADQGRDLLVVLMHAIVDGIDQTQLQRGKRLPDDWESFALVIDVRADGTYASSHGFAYGGLDWVRPVSVDPDFVRDPLLAFMRDRYAGDDVMPVKVLFQLRLSDGSYDLTFEDSDRSRWQVTPLNFVDVRTELRPQFVG